MPGLIRCSPLRELAAEEDKLIVVSYTQQWRITQSIHMKHYRSGPGAGAAGAAAVTNSW